MCYTESSHEICQVFPRKCVLLETWADLISFSQSLWPSGGGRWRLLGVWRKSDQLTGVVPRNPGNHSTYPPKKNMRCEKHISYHLINSQNGQGSTSPCTVSRARLKSWNDTLVRCQGRSYPAIQVARPNDVNLSMSTTQGAFPVRLRPIRSMTSVTVLSAMISLTFCFWSIACKSCRTETESPTLRGCENRTTTAYKHFTQNSN